MKKNLQHNNNNSKKKKGKETKIQKITLISFSIHTETLAHNEKKSNICKIQYKAFYIVRG